MNHTGTFSVGLPQPEIQSRWRHAPSGGFHTLGALAGAHMSMMIEFGGHERSCLARSTHRGPSRRVKALNPKPETFNPKPILFANYVPAPHPDPQLNPEATKPLATT